MQRKAREGLDGNGMGMGMGWEMLERPNGMKRHDIGACKRESLRLRSSYSMEPMLPVSEHLVLSLPHESSAGLMRAAQKVV